VVLVVGAFTTVHLRTLQANARRAEFPRLVGELVHAPDDSIRAGLQKKIDGMAFSVEAIATELLPVAGANFRIDRHEVRVRDYRACVESGWCSPHGVSGGSCNWGQADRDDHPMNCVDVYNAAAYCATRGKRLPTEVEWELAARGPEHRDHPWGAGGPAGRVCWSGGETGDRAGTCVAGQYTLGATPDQVADLAGNVEEWTSSRYRCPPEEPDCTRGEEHFVVRGGSWKERLPEGVRGTSRSHKHPAARVGGVGFRCVAD
jgi:formylglycine-generating enzyme required for sulfatase activity